MLVSWPDPECELWYALSGDAESCLQQSGRDIKTVTRLPIHVVYMSEIRQVIVWVEEQVESMWCSLARYWRDRQGMDDIINRDIQWFFAWDKRWGYRDA